METVKKITEQVEQLKTVKTRLDFVLETTTLKPHDSTTIEQNILDIRKVETSIETLKNKLKKNLKKTIPSSGRVLTGHKTAQKQKLSRIAGL